MDDFFKALDAVKRRQLVVISRPEAARAVALAKGRNLKEARLGAMTYGGRCKGVEAHLIGMFGEMAVTKFCGGVVDERIFKDHGDDGTDCVIEGVGKIGIKCTSYLEEPYLRVEMEHFDADIAGYVLCALDKKKAHEIQIIGWATADMVQAAPQKQFVPDGPMNYVLYEHELLDINTLKVKYALG